MLSARQPADASGARSLPWPRDLAKAPRRGTHCDARGEVEPIAVEMKRRCLPWSEDPTTCLDGPAPPRSRDLVGRGARAYIQRLEARSRAPGRRSRRDARCTARRKRCSRRADRPAPMRFCSQCGAPVALRQPEGDTLSATSVRHAVRSTPQSRWWSAPYAAGRTASCCAAGRSSRAPDSGSCRPAIWSARAPRKRPAEAWEEAGARIDITGLLAVYNVVRIGQVQLFYGARLVDPQVVAGRETLELDLFDWRLFPWTSWRSRACTGSCAGRTSSRTRTVPTCRRSALSLGATVEPGEQGPADR